MSGDLFFARLVGALSCPGADYTAAGAAAGAGVLDLGVGEARFPMPAPVCRELGDVAAGTQRLWYGDPGGQLGLRTAYLRHRDPACEVDPETVLVTAGGKEAAMLALRYLLHQRGGGPVLAPVPGWEPYRLWARAAGAEVIGYDPLALANHPDRLRELILTADPRPSVLVLNYPNNPTGATVSRQVLDRIMVLAVEFGLGVVCDEVYRAFADPAVSAVGSPAYDPRRHLVVDSVSKSLAVAGLRVGFLLADPGVVDMLSAYRSTYASCTSVLAQSAATALLESRTAAAWLSGVRAEVGQGLAATAAALTEAGIEVVSHGGLYLWCATPAPTPWRAQNTSATTPVRFTPGRGFGDSARFRLCPARAGLDPAAAAAAVAAVWGRA
ncbi:pyridoxal phosphate-dependent aminotransferase [Nocardia sp. NPDC048505]|uniref:pyridoxal phosphate-dependent aminotransferase n=1 Tax=Nocardia sp. NPDC048505 TaxID=3155756 RepID=UPI0033C7F480